eukprot:508040-Prorocentrum_minimum.AAC.1
MDRSGGADRDLTAEVMAALQQIVPDVASLVARTETATNCARRRKPGRAHGGINWKMVSTYEPKIMLTNSSAHENDPKTYT